MKRLCIICMLCIIPLSALAVAYHGTFTAPMEREDGSVMSLSEIEGYLVILNGTPRVGLLGSTSTSYVIDPIPVGDNTIELVTYDTDGRMSKPSKTVIAKVKSDANPKPVTGHSGVAVY